MIAADACRYCDSGKPEIADEGMCEDCAAREAQEAEALKEYWIPDQISESSAPASYDRLPF